MSSPTTNEHVKKPCAHTMDEQEMCFSTQCPLCLVAEIGNLRNELRSARLMFGAVCLQTGGQLRIKKATLVELHPRSEVEMFEDPATGDYTYQLRTPT